MDLKARIPQIGLFLLLPFLLNAQSNEDCNNGIDDDGDGLIDCFDADCSCTGQCEDFYYSACDVDCNYVPPCGQISLGVQWTSDAETGTYSPLVAGDMDADGIPDIVTTRVEAGDLYIIDGATGLTKVHVVNPNTVWPGGTAPAIADLDHDGFGEVVIVGFNRRMYCYEHTGALKWTSNPVGYNARYRYAVPNIADFDNNGWAEINVGNQVYNGQTGALLASGGPFFSAGEHPARVAGGFSFASPVAIDVLPDNFCFGCAGLEIVAGNQVLSVNLTTGLVLPVVVAPSPFTDGFTSVADIDRDGDLDAIVQGRKGNQNTVYCWEIETPTILREYTLLNNWQEGASRVNVADLNGDGQLEINFVSHPWLYALKNDFTPLWINPILDASSITCTSVFDFCGDGAAEVVYRSEHTLQVLDGSNGGMIWEDDCLSLTHIENPLILDVDADGQTEIVIECGTNGSNLTGTVVAYETIGTPVIPTRKVWNQHAYFNTNINDDLSVPRYQQNPNIIGDSLGMNTFLNQYFKPAFPAPDGVITYQSAVCNPDSLIITVEICNTGDKPLPSQTPISAYLGNPQNSAAPWISAVLTDSVLGIGVCKKFSFSLPRITNDTVFLVLNDDHSIPTPFNLIVDFPATAVGECSFSNNIASFFFPDQPVQLGLDVAICLGDTLSFGASGFDIYQWSSTANLSCTSCDTVILIPGNSMELILEAGYLNGCKNRDTVMVTVFNPVNMIVDTSICYGQNFVWNGQTIAPDSSRIFSFQTVQGCDSIVLVQVHGSNLGTFQTTVDTSVCFGSSLMIHNVSLLPGAEKTFVFSSIAGCDSTVLVRVHGTGLGTYQFTIDTAVCLGSTLMIHNTSIEPDQEKSFSFSSISGCDSTVLIRVAPLDTFALIEDRVICYGDTSYIFGIPQTLSGEYPEKFKATNGCDSTRWISLYVLPQIQLALDGTVACFNEANASITSTVTNGIDPLFYVWNIAGNHFSEVNNVSAGDYSLTVTDGNNCTETESITIQQYPQTFFTVSVDSASCYDEYDGYIGIQTDDNSLLFQFNGAPYNQVYAYPNLHAGTYFIVSQDVYGCTDTIATTVLQPPLFSIQLPADTTVDLGASVPLQINLSGLNPVSWIWSDTSYLSCLSCPNPIIQTPLHSTRYELRVKDIRGCEATDEMILTVENKIGVFIPNAIGGSGANSQLTLGFNPAVRKVTLFRIFDRWGELLHESVNALPGDASLSWDGRFKGDLVNPGVYLWQIELELVDGSILKKVGDLTVIR